jgi:hypothetical protein
VAYGLARRVALGHPDADRRPDGRNTLYRSDIRIARGLTSSVTALKWWAKVKGKGGTFDAGRLAPPAIITNVLGEYT